jgi:hypothetical protein
VEEGRNDNAECSPVPMALEGTIIDLCLRQQ